MGTKKNIVDTPLKITEIFRVGPRVKAPRNERDWDFLVYELKKLKVTPGEAYRIIANLKDKTSSIRYDWKMLRLTMYVWERLHESEKLFNRPKIDTIREVVGNRRYQKFFYGFFPDLEFDHEKEVKLLYKLITEKPTYPYLKEGYYFYPGTKKVIPQKVLDRILFDTPKK